MMTVVYNGEEHVFHKVIICYQSGFFAKAFKNFKVSATSLVKSSRQFQVNALQEAETNTVQLEHDDPKVLDAMFCYLTTCDFQFKSELKEAWKGEALDNAKSKQMILEELAFLSEVYAVAGNYLHYPQQSYWLTATEFYDITNLKTLTVVKARALMPDRRAPALPTKLITHIYESTPEKDRALRDIAVDWYFRSVAAKNSWDGEEAVADEAMQIPSFARDLVVETGRRMASCSVCETVLPSESRCCNCRAGLSSWGDGAYSGWA